MSVVCFTNFRANNHSFLVNKRLRGPTTIFYAHGLRCNFTRPPAHENVHPTVDDEKKKKKNQRRRGAVLGAPVLARFLPFF